MRSASTRSLKRRAEIPRVQKLLGCKDIDASALHKMDTTSLGAYFAAATQERFESSLS
jgi:hypothetical protein